MHPPSHSYWLALLELVNLSNAQFTDGMIGPETEMPAADHEMLNLSAVVIASRLVPKLGRMLRKLEYQSQNLFLLGLREAKQKRRGLA
jgi:hypothetical protein